LKDGTRYPSLEMMHILLLLQLVGTALCMTCTTKLYDGTSCSGSPLETQTYSFQENTCNSVSDLVTSVMFPTDYGGYRLSGRTFDDDTWSIVFSWDQYYYPYCHDTTTYRSQEYSDSECYRTDPWNYYRSITTTCQRDEVVTPPPPMMTCTTKVYSGGGCLGFPMVEEESYNFAQGTCHVASDIVSSTTFSQYFTDLSVVGQLSEDSNWSMRVSNGKECDGFSTYNSRTFNDDGCYQMPTMSYYWYKTSCTEYVPTPSPSPMVCTTKFYGGTDCTSSTPILEEGTYSLTSGSCNPLSTIMSSVSFSQWLPQLAVIGYINDDDWSLKVSNDHTCNGDSEDNSRTYSDSTCQTLPNFNQYRVQTTCSKNIPDSFPVSMCTTQIYSNGCIGTPIIEEANYQLEEGRCHRVSDMLQSVHFQSQLAGVSVLGQASSDGSWSLRISNDEYCSGTDGSNSLIYKDNGCYILPNTYYTYGDLYIKVNISLVKPLDLLYCYYLL